MHSSKEIAAQLGVSPSAVDKRLERAVQILGSTSRFAAARLLALHETGSMYDHLPCDPIDIPIEPATPISETKNGSSGIVRRLMGFSFEEGRSGRPRNELSKPQRLLLIVALVLSLSISMMVLLNVGQTLSELIAEHRSPKVGPH